MRVPLQTNRKAFCGAPQTNCNRRAREGAQTTAKNGSREVQRFRGISPRYAVFRESSL